MKGIFYSTLLILFWCNGVSVSYGQTIHAIVFAATEDATIGAGSQKSFELISQEVERIANHTGMETILYYRTKQSFSRVNLERVYRRLDKADLSDDVVLFYFLGHGYKSKSKYPNLLFTNTKGELSETELKATTVNLGTISKTLLKKKARLTLVFGEACNDALDESGVYDGDINTMSRPPVMDKARYQRLFRHASGSFILASSERGQPSYISASKGGAFTQAFLSALHQQAKKNGKDIKTTSWAKLLQLAREETKNIAKQKRFQYLQTPQYAVTKKLRYYTPPPDAEAGKRKKYGFFTWLVSLLAPNKVERSFKRAMKAGNLLALETILEAKGEEGDKLKQKMLKTSPVTFYMAQAIIYEEKEDTLNALINYKIAYELGKANRSKRDQKLIDKILKRNDKKKVILGLNEARNYQTWLKQKFFRYQSYYEDDIELADTEIDRLENEIEAIEETIKEDRQKITDIEQAIQNDNQDVAAIQEKIKALDKNRQQKVEIKLSSTKKSKETMAKIEQYIQQLEQSGVVDKTPPPKYFDNAVVEFKFAKRKTAASLEPTASGYDLGKYCTDDIQETARSIMDVLLRPVNDVPKDRRDELKIKLKIVGNSDWIGARSGQPLSIWYDCEADVFQEYTNNDGDTKTFRLTAGERIRITNEELAFLRAYCAYNIIIDILRSKGVFNYEVQFQAIEHEIPADIDPKDREAGRKYRGIDIDMTVENLYKHYIDTIKQLEADIRQIRRKTAQRRDEIMEIEERIEQKQATIQERRDAIKVEEEKKEKLKGILRVVKADREINRVKAIQAEY